MKTNKVYNESCLTTMSKMHDEFIDLVVTSPPYDNLRTYGQKDLKELFNFEIFQNIADELYRVVKEGGVVVWVVGDAVINGSESGTSFKQALYFKEIGFNIYDTMIYEKSGCPFSNTARYLQMFEYMFVFSKGKPRSINLIKDRKNINHYRTMNTGTKYRNKSGDLDEIKKEIKIKEMGLRFNIWRYKTGFNNSYKDKFVSGHPAVFPELLANDHIISWSNENDLIYDPFMGSGTVAKMCIINHRNFIGSEINEKYYNICLKRIDKAKEQSLLF